MDIVSIEKKRKQRFAFLCIAFALVAGIGFSIVDFFEKEKIEFITDILIIVFLIFNLLAMKKGVDHLILYRTGLALLCLTFLYNIVIGAGSGTVIYWLFPFPLVFFFFLGRKEGGLFSALFFSIICVLLINPFSLKIYAYELSVSFRFLASFLLVTLIAYGLEASRERFVKLFLENHEKLLEEKQNLQQAMGQIKTLNGLIPICCQCKKVRNDEGYWQQVETYVRDHTHADFSHGICPDCVAALYESLKDSGRAVGSGQ